MHITAEIRWFWPIETPAEIKKWLDSTDFPEGETEVRTDYYLMSGSPAGGIKLRSKRLETKLLIEELAPVSPMENLGKAGKWSKWSAPETMTLADHTAGDENWLPVQKDRRIATYITGEKRWAKQGETPGEGCEVEIGQVSVVGKKCGTLCLECFSDKGREAEVLNQSLNMLITEEVITILSEIEALSYPEWLNRLK